MDRMFHILVSAIIAAYENTAEYKTRKFWEGEMDKKSVEFEGTKIPAIVARLVNTFLYILTRKSITNIVGVDGEPYPISDYKFPQSWWLIAKARRVFWSERATDRAPFFCAQPKVDKGDLATPGAIERFFVRYNQFQPGKSQEGDDGKVVASRFIVNGTSADDFNQPCMFNDLQALMINGRIADNNPSGTVEPKVSQFLDIPHPCTEDQLFTTTAFGEEEMSRWLTSMEW